MFNRSYKKYRRMNPEMVTKYLPRDRRDLQESMVADSQANFFVICISLKLFKTTSINREAMNTFSRKLYRLVKRRHTHLWDKSSTSSAIVDQHVGAGTVKETCDSSETSTSG